VAIQAIELYLNALLSLHGHSAVEIRAAGHDLARRANFPAIAALDLRRRTLAHLVLLRDKREYLTARYAPELAGDASQLNRLAATLDEVARKVSTAFDRHAGAAATTQTARAA
jgi:hypothetical protein